MKQSLLMCALMASVLAACGGYGSTRTAPTVQTPNTYDVRNPTASAGAQNIPVLAQPKVVQQRVAAQDMGGYVVVPQQQPVQAVQPAYNPSQHNHAAVANAGTTAVSDDYVRASTENFTCDNGANITIKHLQADTITIALEGLTGNSILKLASSASGELYRAQAALFGKPTQWHQKSAQANLTFVNANNQAVSTACRLR